MVQGNTHYFGCLGKETVIQNHKDFSKNRKLIDGTAVTQISKMTLRSDNKTGVRGVIWVKSRQCYRASIGFKGKQYHLGNFHDLEKAKLARQEAEERIFGGFLEWYREMFGETAKAAE